MTRQDDRQRLREHLVATGLAGQVATGVWETRRKIRRFVDGDIDCTFGLDDWSSIDFDEVVAVVEQTFGADLTEPATDSEVAGTIDPEVVLDGIDRHADALRQFVAGNGPRRVLLATGHAAGLLEHYAALAQRLVAAGCEVVTACDEQLMGPDESAKPYQPSVGVRFVSDVACVFDGRSLLHSHRPFYMEAMLDVLAQRNATPSLVLADHGMAGAAIQRGLPTAAIVDLNDPALTVAQHRGRYDAALSIDDNLAPSVFRPVTEAIIRQAGL